MCHEFFQRTSFIYHIINQIILIKNQQHRHICMLNFWLIFFFLLYLSLIINVFLCLILPISCVLDGFLVGYVAYQDCTWCIFTEDFVYLDSAHDSVLSLDVPQLYSNFITVNIQYFDAKFASNRCSVLCVKFVLHKSINKLCFASICVA